MRGRESRVGKHADRVSNDDLLDQAVDEAQHALRKRIETFPPFADLRVDLLEADDRPGDHLRDRDVESEIERVAQRRDALPEDVDDVAHRVERVEGDADRQNDIVPGDHPPFEALADIVQLEDEEVRVFEIGEDGEVEDDAAREREPAQGELCRADAAESRAEKVIYPTESKRSSVK